MSFHQVGAVSGIDPAIGHEAALRIAERSHDPADGWSLLEACGLVSYKSGKPPKQPAERAAVIKYPRVGQ